MISAATSHVLDSVDSSGLRACLEKSRGHRSDAGQFFTPAPIARCLAGWFGLKGLNRRALHLLDAGAGVGVLTAAVVERITKLQAAGALPKLYRKGTDLMRKIR